MSKTVRKCRRLKTKTWAVCFAHAVRAPAWPSRPSAVVSHAGSAKSPRHPLCFWFDLLHAPRWAAPLLFALRTVGGNLIGVHFQNCMHHSLFSSLVKRIRLPFGPVNGKLYVVGNGKLWGTKETAKCSVLTTENICEEFSICILKGHMPLVENCFLFFFYFLCFLKEIVLNDRSLVFVLDFSVCLQVWLFFLLVAQYTAVHYSTVFSGWHC